MHIEVTKEAVEYLKPFQKEGEKWLLTLGKIGCVCSEDFIFALRLVTEISDQWESQETALGTLYYPKNATLYLGEQMKIIYQKDKKSLDLIGTYGGLVTGNMMVQNSDGSQRLI